MVERIWYAIGEQDFEKMVTGDWLYVDKTGYIEEFKRGGYFFLGRPRRFGKSLFLSTLKYFFLGRRDLFKGLEADKLKWSWERYPVLYLDLNGSSYSKAKDLKSVMMSAIAEFEKEFALTPTSDNISVRFSMMLKGAYEKTGKRVVILVDEYDKPLVSSLDDKEAFESFRNILYDIYSNFKNASPYIHLVFLTGVSRFGKLSIFSGLNNVKDITFSDRFSSLCGITQEELDNYLKNGIKELASKYGENEYDIRERLKTNYDGYRFSPEGKDIYNPFSLLNVFDSEEIGFYWNMSGIPTILAKLLKRHNVDLQKLLEVQCSMEDLRGFDLESSSLEALFYQTGYLTIKSYDRTDGLVRLGIPNLEVRQGLMSYLLPSYANLDNEKPSFVVKKFVEEFRKGDVDGVMKRLKSLFSSVFYKMEMDKERNVHNALLILMILVGLDVKTEYETSDGRVDLFVATDKLYYIIELKLGGSASQAIAQINDRNYSLPFAVDGKKIIKIGVNFSTETRTIGDYIVEYE